MARIFVVVILAFLIGCSPSAPNKELLAKINNYSLYREDFIDELKTMSDFERAGRTKEELLEGVIEKKLLLLQAQQAGLDKEGIFMKMVQRFWEQSLLRSIIEKKIKEFVATTSISEEEIKTRTNELDKKVNVEDIRDSIIREKVNKRFEAWLDALKKRAKIYINTKALEKITIPASE
ncbi:MAG: hypothetical protein NC828_05790 [Candidatus Omnitrophica bacterium]|nr:hypothetical protein [Candidatus Omnitrophota bacterium]